MKLNLGLENLQTQTPGTQKSVESKLMESMSVLYNFLGYTYKKELDTILAGITTDSLHTIRQTSSETLACETLNASVDVSCEGWFRDFIANLSFRWKSHDKWLEMMRKGLAKLKENEEIPGFEEKVIPVSIVPYADAAKLIGLLEKARNTYNSFKFSDLTKGVNPSDQASVTAFKSKALDFIKTVRDATVTLDKEASKYNRAAVRDKSFQSLGYTKKSVTDVLQKTHDILDKTYAQWRGDLQSLSSQSFANATAVSFKARVFGAGPEYVIAKSVQQCIAALSSYITAVFTNGYVLARTSFKLGRYCAGLKIEAPAPTESEG